MTSSASLPRHDYYQTETEVIISLYVKGYGAAEVKDEVKINFEAVKVVVELPTLAGQAENGSFVIDPLYAAINPDKSSARVLGSKIELKLAKAYPTTWPSVISDGATAPSPSQSTAGPSSRPFATDPKASVPVSRPKKEKRNWDKVVDDELKEDEGEGQKDPNAGGDAALKEFFNQIYKDADEDTRKAMIKSYTESGGTALSTNWSEIGKEKTPIKPPEGMEARKY